MTAVAIEPEGVVRDWLYTQSALTALTTGGIHIGPPTTPPAGPHVSMFLVSGPMDATYTPRMVALLQFDCYAARRKDAADVATQLINTLWPLSDGGHYIATGVRVDGMRVTRNGFDPDPATTRPRYAVDAELTIAATG